jgi:hypothetical protein
MIPALNFPNFDARFKGKSKSPPRVWLRQSKNWRRRSSQRLRTSAAAWLLNPPLGNLTRPSRQTSPPGVPPLTHPRLPPPPNSSYQEAYSILTAAPPRLPLAIEPHVTMHLPGTETLIIVNMCPHRCFRCAAIPQLVTCTSSLPPQACRWDQPHQPDKLPMPIAHWTILWGDQSRLHGLATRNASHAHAGLAFSTLLV